MRIALAGKICSGKTTVADKLVKQKKYTKISIASELKRYAKEIFKMEKKDRELLQNFGSFVTSIKPDAWLELTREQIESAGNNVVIDDLRFPLEAEYLKKNGFLIFRINVDPETQKRRIIENYPDDYDNHLERLNHASETALDYYAFDKVFKNSQELIDLLEVK